jgi:acyl-CoA synthetase (AMP-forming)/AMP-acid ligase II
VPDEVLGEIGVAVVVAAPGATPELDALRAHCAAALSDYKSPDALVVVDELPLTPMMKVDAGRLADLGARGAEQRRSLLAANRRPVPGVLGSGPTGAADQKERA